MDRHSQEIVTDLPESTGVPESAKLSEIPIRNLWYLVLYALDFAHFRSRFDMEAENSPDFINLLAKVFIHLLRQQFRRGFHQEYLERIEELTRLRGRIIFSDSMMTLPLGRAVCQFDELSPDITVNRLLSTTIDDLLRSPAIRGEGRKKLHTDLRQLRARFPRIEKNRPSDDDMRRIVIPRHNASYRLLITICRMIRALLLPTEQEGSDPLAALWREGFQEYDLFEAFVRNFYRLEFEGVWAVKSETLEWPVISNDRRGLPAMRTDMTLHNSGRRIVIDTKFYREVMVEHRGKCKPRSTHLYQIFSYLATQMHQSPQHATAEGILLYPTNGKDWDKKWKLCNGLQLRIATINLDDDWRSIDKNLRSLIRAPAE